MRLNDKLHLNRVHTRFDYALKRKSVQKYDVGIFENWQSEQFESLHDIFKESPNATDFIIRFPFAKISEEPRYRTVFTTCLHSLLLSIAYCNPKRETTGMQF